MEQRIETIIPIIITITNGDKLTEKKKTSKS